MQNIVEFIKEQMSNRGMTYDLLAERVGTTRQNLWTKLNKNTRPNFETVRKILAALDYDLVVEKKKGAADPGENRYASRNASESAASSVSGSIPCPAASWCIPARSKKRNCRVLCEHR